MSYTDRLVVGGIVTARMTRAEMAAQMVVDRDLAAKGTLPRPRVMVSSNGSVIAKFHAQREFRSLISQADVVDADGMPLVLASRVFHRRPLVERVATTDFVHDASAMAARHGVHFYFLGAKPGVAEKAASNLRRLHQGLQIVGVRHGYFDPADEARICEEVQSLKTDVLWVGLGSPYQEAFAIRNRERLKGLTWIRTCGGLFDHCSGSVKRAPIWMQKMGLEWMHRVAKEPLRLGGRYLKTNPVAAYHLLTKTYEGELRSKRRRHV
jgi:exopolysaccharide biosynthesis WecB/TagA/CpsF family protein